MTHRQEGAKKKAPWVVLRGCQELQPPPFFIQNAPNSAQKNGTMTQVKPMKIGPRCPLGKVKAPGTQQCSQDSVNQAMAPANMDTMPRLLGHIA